MHGRLPGAILYLASLTGLGAAGGCGTCATVDATYDEVWQATREALLAQAEMKRSVPVGRYDKGTFEATVKRPSQRDELQYRADIKPVGGTERVKRKVCVRVREVHAPIVDGVVGDRVEKVQASRRKDLETSVARHLERAFEENDEAG